MNVIAPQPPATGRGANRGSLVARAARLLAAGGASLAGRRVLAMCSGGVDSVVLVDVVARLPRGVRPSRLEVLWCDHGLRDTRADHEAAIGVAARHGLELHVRRARVQLAEGGNLQARAREWRYAQARACARDRGFDIIVTGHTASDQLETVLYGLVASSGPRALSGIPIVGAASAGEAPVVRPLISASRADVEHHARSAGLVWSEDPTNADPERGMRVHLRHRVVPALLEAHPGAGSNLLRTSALAAAGASTADELAEVLVGAWQYEDVADRIDVRKVAALGGPARRAVLAAWLRRAGAGRAVTARAVESLAVLAAVPSSVRHASGRTVELERASVRRDGYHLVFTPAPAPVEE